MKPEQRMWQQLRNSIGWAWHATRHEDLLATGVPDLSWGAGGVDGWMELKCNLEWPKKLSTPVKPASPFTPQQKAWLKIRAAHGAGKCWLLWKVEGEWLLFSHERLQDIGTMTQSETRLAAYARWNNTPKAGEFLSAITGLPQARFKEFE